MEYFMQEVMVLEGNRMLVQFKFDWHSEIGLQSKEEKEIVIKVVFKNMSWNDHKTIEPITTEKIQGEFVRDVKIYTNIHTYREEILRRFLLDWNIDIDLEFDKYTGLMSDECLERVMSLPGPFIRTLVEKYDDAMSVEEDEESLLRQCTILFSPHCGGVVNPLDTISLYCTLGNFWEKFGLNRDALKNLSYKEFLQLKYMLSKEGETKSNAGKLKAHRPTQVVMGGGKARASRGTVVRED